MNHLCSILKQVVAVKEIISIKLDKGSGAPLYRQLGEALAKLIERGVLPAHTKLPPIRTMSRALKVNNVTVVAAYKYLETNSFAYSIVGSGTYAGSRTDDVDYLTGLILSELDNKISALKEINGSKK